MKKLLLSFSLSVLTGSLALMPASWANTQDQVIVEGEDARELLDLSEANREKNSACFMSEAKAEQEKYRNPNPQELINKCICKNQKDNEKYIKNVEDILKKHPDWEGKNLSFKGKDGKLLPIVTDLSMIKIGLTSCK